MAKIRRKREEWPEWVRPYVERRDFTRRKNQYSTDETISFCFSVTSVPFHVMLENAKSKTLKWDVSGTCMLCEKSFHGPWNNFWLRKRHIGEEVCGKCVRKEAYTEEWKEHNSKAQKMVQGMPDARGRMSARIKRVHRDDPSISKRISRGLRMAYQDNPEFRKKVAVASRRNWNRPEYQEKVTGHGYHHGYYVGGGTRIYFASSWELMFLEWCAESDDVSDFDRCSDRVPYVKPSGGTAYYHPDFTVEWTDGVKRIIEVKGGRQPIELVERKRAAAELFYDGMCEYIILFGEDLKRMGIFRESRHVGKWIEKLVLEGKVEEHAKGKSDKSR